MKTNYKNFLSACVLLASAACIPSTPAMAQDRTQEIDKIFSGATAETPGCVCAVSQNGKVVMNKAYGSADLERNIPLTPSSVLDAGSVVKQFVAASVLMLVEEGRLSLTEDIRKYVPELPDYGHKITLNHLLTHTSGIRDWTGIRPLADGDPDALTLTLRQRGLNFVPGDEWSYSNSGYVLLKEIVGRTSGMSFADFTRKRLFEPLKMSSTQYLQEMTAVVNNRALAYEKKDNAWKVNMYLGNDRGGGGALMTTASDLLIWNDALANKTLGAFITAGLHEPAVLNNGRKVGYARGLYVEPFRRGGQLVWHTGGAAGYSTLLARLPEQGLSVAIMCNADGGARTQFAARIFDLFLPPSTATQAAPSGMKSADEPIATNPHDLNNKAGLFFNEENGQALRLAVNNNMLAISGGGPLISLAPNRFRSRAATLSFLSDAEFELTFVTDNRFEIKTKEGNTLRYRRAHPYSPSPEDLQRLAGQYESNEIGAVLEIVPDKGGITVRSYRNPAKALKLMPADNDTFILSMMTVRFIKDKSGRVLGFSYSNPLVRNVRFTRTGNASNK